MWLDINSNHTKIKLLLNFKLLLLLYSNNSNTTKIIINSASLKYIDRNRKKLRAEYPDFNDFLRHYEVPQSLIDDIVAQAAEKDVKPKDDEELQATVPDLKFTLKALVAYDIWDRNEYFRIILRR